MAFALFDLSVRRILMVGNYNNSLSVSLLEVRSLLGSQSALSLPAPDFECRRRDGRPCALYERENGGQRTTDA